MRGYVVGRVVQALVVLLFMTFLVFWLARLSGDPLALIAPAEWTPQQVSELRVQMGLDKPWYDQYGIFLSGVLHGDFGASVRTGRPASELVFERLPASIELAVASLLASVIIAVPIGVYSAKKRGGALDVVARIMAVLGQSMPSFWLGLLLIYVFAVWLGVLPVGGEAGLRYLVLPAITMGWYAAAGIMRLTRSSMLDTLDSEYIKLARVKGLSENTIIWKHAFRNACLPVLTFISILFIMHLGGAVVVETVFGWPGVGRLLMQAVSWRDFSTIQAVVMLLSVLYVLANLLVDISYAYLNPKIHYGRR